MDSTTTASLRPAAGTSQRHYESLGLGGLHAVRVELDHSLTRARQQIEEYLENLDSSEPLEIAARELHQVRGTASIIQCFGVAALAEEMKQCSLDLAHGEIVDPEAALAALTAGLVQLTDYLDALLSGFDDCVLVLQPALNELRLARGRAVLTEQDLFVSQMHALGLQLPMPMDMTHDGSAQAQATRLLQHYHGAMVRWLRGEPARQPVSTIGRVAELIAANATEPRLYELWRIAAAGAEVILTNELTETTDIKRLYGRVGMSLKVLAQDGEWEAVTRAGDLSYRLLFHIGRSRSRAKRTMALRQAFMLDVYLPSSEQVDRLRRHLRGPSTDLLNRVAAEIRADLATIQDRVDLAVRTGTTAGSELAPIASRLRNIGAALQMLGIESLYRLVDARVKGLPGLLSEPTVRLADWMDFATDLLHVEQSLEDALFRQLGKGYRPLDGDEAGATPRVADWRHGVSAVMRESLINLAKLKDAVALLMREGDAAGIADCPRLINEIACALQFIGPQQAAGTFGRLTQHLSRAPLMSLKGDAMATGVFADVIAAAELYLEARRDSLPLIASRLSDLDLRLGLLEGLLAPVVAAPEPEFDTAESLLIDPSEALSAAPMEPVAPAPAVPVAAPVPAGDDEIDPAIREVFLEEADEVLQSLNQRIPRWLRDADDTDSLAEIRRAFHTLKGSGRMVGANDIGEFAWAIENLFNRCLDGTLRPDATIHGLVRDALRLLPPLIDAFRNGAPGPDEVAQVAERAHAVAAGKRASDEDDLRQVFQQDALERLDLLDEWLQRTPEDVAVEIPNDVLRAFHTLRGAGPLVNAPHIGDVAGHFEDYLEELRGGELLLPPDAVPLMRDCARALRVWITTLDQPLPDAAEPAALVARIEAVRHQVPESAAQSASDRQLAEIFAGEAFELVERIEAQIKEWAVEPTSEVPPREISAELHTLRGAALMASCPSIAAIAQAFRERLDGAGAMGPREAFFDAALDIAEGMFRQLDDYHEGVRTGDGEPWVSAVHALNFGEAGSAVEAAPVAVPPPTTDEVAPAVPAIDATVEAPVEDDPEAEVLRTWPSIELAKAAQDEAIDEELREIFVAEAEELLELTDEMLARLGERADDSEALTELRRAMHTFKGSARMAGFHALGEIGYALEQRAEAAMRGSAVIDTAFIAGFISATNEQRRSLGLPEVPPPAVEATEIPGDVAAPAEADVDEAVIAPFEPEFVESASETPTLESDSAPIWAEAGDEVVTDEVGATACSPIDAEVEQPHGLVTDQSSVTDDASELEATAGDHFDTEAGAALTEDDDSYGQIVSDDDASIEPRSFTDEAPLDLDAALIDTVDEEPSSAKLDDSATDAEVDVEAEADSVVPEPVDEPEAWQPETGLEPETTGEYELEPALETALSPTFGEAADEPPTDAPVPVEDDAFGWVGEVGVDEEALAEPSTDDDLNEVPAVAEEATRSEDIDAIAAPEAAESSDTIEWVIDFGEETAAQQPQVADAPADPFAGLSEDTLVIDLDEPDVVEDDAGLQSIEIVEAPEMSPEMSPDGVAEHGTPDEATAATDEAGFSAADDAASPESADDGLRVDAADAEWDIAISLSDDDDVEAADGEVTAPEEMPVAHGDTEMAASADLEAGFATDAISEPADAWSSDAAPAQAWMPDPAESVADGQDDQALSSDEPSETGVESMLEGEAVEPAFEPGVDAEAGEAPAWTALDGAVDAAMEDATPTDAVEAPPVEVGFEPLIDAPAFEADTLASFDAPAPVDAVDGSGWTNAADPQQPSTEVPSDAFIAPGFDESTIAHEDAESESVAADTDATTADMQVSDGWMDTSSNFEPAQDGSFDPASSFVDVSDVGGDAPQFPTDTTFDGASVADDAAAGFDAPSQEPASEPTDEPAYEPIEAAAQGPSPGAGPIDDAPATVADVLDPELVEIFIAEASELLEALERDLRVWTDNPYDGATAAEVQRALHTLKGGARMAGLTGMGTLVHNLESLIESAQMRSGVPDQGVFVGLSAGVDSIQGMVDDINRGDLASAIGQVPDAQLLHDPGYAMPVEPAVSPAPPPMEAESVATFGDLPVVDPQNAVAWQSELFWHPEIDAATAAARRETARVPVDRLDSLLNEAGEISITRSRLEQQNVTLQYMLRETAQTLARVRDQLRQLDIETEAQIAARGMSRGDIGADRYETEFDALEMDRYTRMQELSRALSESLGDLSSLHMSMDHSVGENEALLQQQARINTEMQNALMGTLMVPFSRQTQRLQRVVRQTAHDNGRIADVHFTGDDAELDRNVLERMTAPMEHLLRNAVVHGIETPEHRRSIGKPDEGRIDVTLRRDGTQLLISLVDDGRGLNVDAIRETAIRRGLMPPDSSLSDDEVIQFIFAPGFSTAQSLTQDAGRGIGMDVVVSEIKQLGGLLEIGSVPGQGTRFLIRLPLTLAIAQSLLVGIGGEQYAIPLPSVEGIVRLPRDDVDRYLRGGDVLAYGGHDYPVRSLGDYIGVAAQPPADSRTLPAILIRIGEGLAAGGGERRIAVVVDQLLGNRQIVSKAVGQQASTVSGISGATILADGRVVLILDVSALVQDRTRRDLVTQASLAAQDAAAATPVVEKPAKVARVDTVMVVDDSITMRRVAERLLQRNGFAVVTAKDGLDAMAQLQTEMPVAILLDIEMPRADGFEVAAFVRNSERIAHTPIIMITSRSGDKHRERARKLGVNRYLIKPYQEEELLENLRAVLSEVAA